MNDVMDSNRAYAMQYKITMQDEHKLSMYECVLRETSIEHDRAIKDCEYVHVIEIETKDESMSTMNEDKVNREMSFKPRINLSTLCKRERLSEMK